MSAHPTYVELRCRTAFSFLEAASLPEDLVDRAAALGYDVIGVGDRDGVYAAPRTFTAARRAGLRALVGADVTIGEGRLYLLAAERTGYRNLCRLITTGKLRAPKGECRLAMVDVAEHADGLIALVTGGETGLLGNAGDTHAADMLRTLRGSFPHDRLYVEVQRHLDRDQERLTRRLLALADGCGVPVVATNDVRHATARARAVLDVLTCVRQKTTLDEAGRRLLRNGERHLKSPAEMAALFRDRPDAIANTRRIAERCTFTLANLGYRFPESPLPSGETPIRHLRALVERGACARYPAMTPRVRAQLDHELAVIAKLDLAGYFLIVSEIVEFCRTRRILVQGRGSAANSAVCYALGITAVDPVRMELLFERFLSEGRGEWPDIDLDLPSGDQREAVIQHMYERYGTRGAAMTANVIT
jgi:error-prone DNA polymerase